MNIQDCLNCEFMVTSCRSHKTNAGVDSIYCFCTHGGSRRLLGSMTEPDVILQENFQICPITLDRLES